jgi:uncharacterized protein YecE (DUF72 family)
VFFVGTSGWQYDDWRGRFYPRDLPKAGWLSFFAGAFPSVEVNNSFYRLPSRETFERWRFETPAGFVVAVKASRYITHVRRLREPEEPLSLLLDHAAGLADRLGPVLFQLPPRFRADLGLLRAFLQALPSRVRAAFEFRDPSWESEDVFESLDRAGAALVWADRPGIRLALPVTGGWAYVRFHQGRRTAPGYTREKLRRWADRLAETPARDAFVYFNNDTGGAAVRDAKTLTKLLLERDLAVATPGEGPALH